MYVLCVGGAILNTLRNISFSCLDSVSNMSSQINNKLLEWTFKMKWILSVDCAQLQQQIKWLAPCVCVYMHTYRDRIHLVSGCTGLGFSNLFPHLCSLIFFFFLHTDARSLALDVADPNLGSKSTFWNSSDCVSYGTHFVPVCKNAAQELQYLKKSRWGSKKKKKKDKKKNR